MKIVKIVAAGVVAAGLLGAAIADAHPRHKVCRVTWHHHHKVRSCHWR